MKSSIKSAAIDDKWYFTGKPCKNGHIAPRLLSNRACRDCAYARRAAYEESEKYTAWKAENKAKVNAEWQQRNKGAVAANVRKYQAAKLQRTPKWLTEEEIRRMVCYYQVAQMRNRESDQEWHVDHIVPLQGETVSGLHVPWNLRVIPATENLSKNNRFEGY